MYIWYPLCYIMKGVKDKKLLELLPHVSKYMLKLQKISTWLENTGLIHQNMQDTRTTKI